MAREQTRRSFCMALCWSGSACIEREQERELKRFQQSKLFTLKWLHFNIRPKASRGTKEGRDVCLPLAWNICRAGNFAGVSVCSSSFPSVLRPRAHRCAASFAPNVLPYVKVTPEKWNDISPPPPTPVSPLLVMCLRIISMLFIKQKRFINFRNSTIARTDDERHV